MKHLLRARHLSPIYGSQTPIAPEMEDLLVIEDVPDIFHVGHVHRAQLGYVQGNFAGKFWFMAKTNTFSG